MTAETVEPVPESAETFENVVTETPLFERVRVIRRGLEATLVEREEAIEALLLGFVAQEHVVFEGPPGAAKSLLIERLMQSISGGRYVRRLMHKFMAVDEILGPMDLGEFQKNRRFRRNLAGGAAEADGLFLDEIFKASAACLNTLLTLLEERQYEDQSGRHEVPLRLCASASNEFPEDDALGALYDRFLLRCRVGYIETDGGLDRLLDAPDTVVPPERITVEEWDRIRIEARGVRVPPGVRKAYKGLRAGLAKEGVILSDRRFKKGLRIVQAAAWLDGEPEATVDHLQALRFVAWGRPSEIERVAVALSKLDRSAVAKVFDEIDGALRAFHARDRSTTGTDEIPALLAQIRTAAAAAKGFFDDKSLTTRTRRKLSGRGTELKEAYDALATELQKGIAL